VRVAHKAYATVWELDTSSEQPGWVKNIKFSIIEEWFNNKSEEQKLEKCMFKKFLLLKDAALFYNLLHI